MMNVYLSKTEKITTKDGHTGIFEAEEKPKREKKENHNCKLCNYKSDRLANLDRHMESHNKVKKPTSCDKCDFTSTSVQTVERHMNSNKHKGKSIATKYRNLTPRKQKKKNPKS